MTYEAGGQTRVSGIGWRWVGLVAATAGLVLGGCTDPDPEPPPVEPSTTPIICEEHAWAYGRITRQLTPEEFLSRVAEADIERVSAIFYPEDHPRTGEFIPVSEWGKEQRSAWGVYITTRGNWPVGAELC